MSDPTGTEPRFRPFANGTEYHAWFGRNCDRCAIGWKTCELEQELVGTVVSEDRTISLSIAHRTGLLDARKNKTQCVRCPEFVQIEVRR